MRQFKINTETHKNMVDDQNNDERDWVSELVANKRGTRNKMADVCHVLKFILNQRRKLENQKL